MQTKLQWARDAERALSDFERDLNKANWHYLGAQQANDVAECRRAVLLLVDAVTGFLAAMAPLPAPTFVPPVIAIALKSALVSLDRGYVEPLVMPSPRSTGGRPPGPSSKQIVRAHAAVVIELGMRAGLSAETAAKAVVHALRGSRYPDDVSETMVIKWREKIRAARRGSFEISEFWRLLRTIEQAVVGVPTEGRKEALQSVMGSLAEGIRGFVDVAPGWVANEHDRDSHQTPPF